MRRRKNLFHRKTIFSSFKIISRLGRRRFDFFQSSSFTLIYVEEQQHLFFFNCCCSSLYVSFKFWPFNASRVLEENITLHIGRRSLHVFPLLWTFDERTTTVKE
jgi:hypothetical protein